MQNALCANANQKRKTKLYACNFSLLKNERKRAKVRTKGLLLQILLMVSGGLSHFHKSSRIKCTFTYSLATVRSKPMHFRLKA